VLLGKRKQDAQPIVDAFYALGERKRASRIKNCRNSLSVCSCSVCSSRKLGFVPGCKDRFCPQCDGKRAYRIWKEQEPAVDEALEQGWIPYILSVSPPNCSGSSLPSQIKSLQEGVLKLYQSEEFGEVLEGATDFVQTTYNSFRKDFHPHVQSLLWLKSDPSLSNSRLLELVRGALGDDKITQVKLAPLKPMSGGTIQDAVRRWVIYIARVLGSPASKKYLPEVLKKIPSSEASEVMSVLDGALFGRRLLTTRGKFRELLRESKEKKREEYKKEMEESGGEEEDLCGLCGSYLSSSAYNWSGSGFVQEEGKQLSQESQPPTSSEEGKQLSQESQTPTFSVEKGAKRVQISGLLSYEVSYAPPCRGFAFSFARMLHANCRFKDVRLFKRDDGWWLVSYTSASSVSPPPEKLLEKLARDKSVSTSEKILSIVSHSVSLSKKEIASLAGVSVRTVIRHLKNHPSGKQQETSSREEALRAVLLALQCANPVLLKGLLHSWRSSSLPPSFAQEEWERFFTLWDGVPYRTLQHSFKKLMTQMGWNTTTFSSPSSGRIVCWSPPSLGSSEAILAFSTLRSCLFQLGLGLVSDSVCSLLSASVQGLEGVPQSSGAGIGSNPVQLSLFPSLVSHKVVSVPVQMSLFPSLVFPKSYPEKVHSSGRSSFSSKSRLSSLGSKPVQLSLFSLSLESGGGGVQPVQPVQLSLFSHCFSSSDSLQESLEKGEEALLIRVQQSLCSSLAPPYSLQFLKGEGWVSPNGGETAVVEPVSEVKSSLVKGDSGFSSCCERDFESSSCLLSGVSLPLGLIPYLSSLDALLEWGSDFVSWVLRVLSLHEESCSCSEEGETGYWGTLWTLLEWVVEGME
jgi:hypothetical protein